MSYEKSLARALLDFGFLAIEKDFYGGWRSYDKSIYRHYGSDAQMLHPSKINGRLPQCGKWVSLTGVEETYAHVFAGTFTDAEQIYLVKAYLTCKCNKIKNATLFYDGTLSDLIRAVTKSSNLLEG